MNTRQFARGGTRAAWKRPLLCGLAVAVSSTARPQTVVPQLDPAEAAGSRPYEMVWANRQESQPPTLRFDDLGGWTIAVDGGAEARLELTRAQNIWDRPVARLRYRGSGQRDSNPTIRLIAPRPVALPERCDSAEMWLYGNRWDWENPPGTPPVRVAVEVGVGDTARRTVELDKVRWQEWWLVHKRLSPPLDAGTVLTALEIRGGWQSDWREIYFDSVRFFREDLAKLEFAARPKRHLKLFEGQSPGANSGPGELAFPTREQTILPGRPGERAGVDVTTDGGQFVFRALSKEGTVSFRFDPQKFLSGITAEYRPGGSNTAAHWSAAVLDGATVHTSQAGGVGVLGSAKLEDGVVSAQYSRGTSLQLRLWNKSLVLDVLNPTGTATELSFGQVSGVVEPRTIWVPYLTYGGGPHPAVLLSRAGQLHLFTSVWLDWYRSNGSEPYAAESTGTNYARINGGVRYHARTDGQRNPMFERIFVTVSPVFEETLPTIPNPVGLHASEAADRLWQESWGPDDYEKQMMRSRMLRAYGIEKLIQCNHEIAWRDGGESFTLRVRAAPKKGGDEALLKYVAHQRSLGWLAGLYSNYTDYAPVNQFWSPDGVQRQSDGSWRSAWPRCYAEKPLKAVEFDQELAPQIEAKYQPNSAYTDVHTAVAPWHYTDYDARVPGAGTFAQTFYAYGELLRNDSRVYGGPIFSEGTYHWLYAGLADGNYALAYDGRPLAKEPLLPVFDLYQIHTKECDIGMGWTANFCDAIPDWKKPENIDRSIDRFLLHTLAYGHIGWLVEEEHGLARTCRSYYMLQQVQARYGLKSPRRIFYYNGSNLVSVSRALIDDLPRSRRQLMVEYPGGLRLWCNDHPTQNWRPTVAEVTLPPSGWAVWTRNKDLWSYSGLDGTNRVDYIRSPAYVYLDGRGAWFNTSEAGTDGALAIRPMDRNQLEVIRISGGGAFVVRRPFGVKGALTAARATDLNGQPLAAPLWSGDRSETRLEVVPGAVSYVLEFGRM